MSYRERAEAIIREPFCDNFHERFMNLLVEADRELAQAQTERDLAEVELAGLRAFRQAIYDHAAVPTICQVDGREAIEKAHDAEEAARAEMEKKGDWISETVV